tara:strand:+ start:68 stop:367 length:300 start_codon:yes stop_codon:yes gene_type:complete
MPEATQRPWGYVHHKGLDQHLVGATLENVAIVEDRHGNAKENAEFIVKAVNNHDALVAALVGMITAYEYSAEHGDLIVGNEDQLRTEVTDATAVLEQVK